MKKACLLLVIALGLGLTLALLGWLGAGDPAQAAPAATTRYVAPGGNCGGATPCYSTIQAAADAATAGDTIKVAQGTYTNVHHLPSLDTSLPLTATQAVAITRSVTIRGGYTTSNWTTPDPAAHPTTLDAQGRGRVLYITGAITPTIEGLRLTGGDATGLGGISWGDVGGGVYVNGARAILTDCLIYSNTAPTGGGGLFLNNGDASLQNNRIYDNNAPHGSGGGLYINTGGPTLRGNAIYTNHCQEWGGGLYLSAGTATLEGNTIHDNTAAIYGGGLALFWCNAALTGNRIYSNTTQGSGGGLLQYGSDPVLSRNVITGNAASVNGGGVSLELGNPTLVNNAIVDNRAGVNGAGVYAVRSNARLLHTTLARNTGGDGSGVYVTDRAPEYSTVMLTNTIIFSHSVGITVTSGNTVTLNGTLWQGNTTNLGGNVNHTNDYTGDPAFAADGYHLYGWSRAIDRGVDAGVTTDVDGEARPIDGVCDLGADEIKAEFFLYIPLVMRNR